MVTARGHQLVARQPPFAFGAYTTGQNIVADGGLIANVLLVADELQYPIYGNGRDTAVYRLVASEQHLEHRPNERSHRIMPLTGDSPIRHPDQDILERDALAQSFVTHVMSTETKDGLVVGVVGKWGSGKTSFLELARKHFESHNKQMTLIDYNPWTFSGTEQLVRYFFLELSLQLKDRKGFSQLAEWLREYGDYLAFVPVAGGWLYRGQLMLRKFTKRVERSQTNQSLVQRDRAIREWLDRRKHPIVVLLDDIDRLSSTEIRDVFRLVRLIANFPNVVYVLAFDRDRVEEALSDDHTDGRKYLEKIVQILYDLPVIPPSVLEAETNRIIFENVRWNVDLKRLDDRQCDEIVRSILVPLLDNIRDIRRFWSSAYGTILDLGDSLEVSDIIALEAVRIFLPDVFLKIREASESLTSIRLVRPAERVTVDAPVRAQIESIRESAGDHLKLVDELIRIIFPIGWSVIDGGGYRPS